MEKYDKIRKSIWLSPEALNNCESGMKLENSRFLNEYVENAINFYTTYLSNDSNKEVVGEIFVEVVEGKLTQTETRLSKLLFKLAVEQAKLSNIVANNLDIDSDELEKLHIKCVEEVKNTNGKINFEDTFKNQRKL